MSAPTLPTKAERAELRRVVGRPRDGYFACVDSVMLVRLLGWADAREAAAEHPGLARHIETLRELAAVHDEPRFVTCGDSVAITAVLAAMGSEGPARRALRRLVDAHEGVVKASTSGGSLVAHREWRDAYEAAEAVLSGGQPAAVGAAWALYSDDVDTGLHGKRRHEARGIRHWWRDDALWTDWHVHKPWRHVFTALGSRHDTPHGPAVGSARWAQRLHGGVIVAVRDKSTGGG